MEPLMLAYPTARPNFLIGANGTLFDPSGASGGFGGPKLPIELVDWSDIRFDSY